MLIKANDVIGLKIFTVMEGKNIDKVEDVVYDPASQRIEALIVNNGGIFSSGKAIAIENIRSIGEDAVVVESEDVLENIDSLKAEAKHIAEDDTYLTKSAVLTEDGNDLGKVTDLLFDSETGKVEELEVSQGGLRNIQSGKKHVKPDNIVTVGEDALIVNSFTEDAFNTQAEEGGMQGMVNKAKTSATAAATGIKEAWESPETQSKINQTKEDVKSAAISGKEQLQKAAEKAKTKLAEEKNDPENQQKIQELKDKAGQTGENIRQQAAQWKETASQEVDQKKQAMEMRQEEEVVGQYLTKNILDNNDIVLAKRGEIVTNELLIQADANGVKEQILQNVSKEPVY